MPSTSTARSKARVVFLDASVLVSAAMSSSGGSFRLIGESRTRGFGLVTSTYTLEEVCRTLSCKRPDLLATVPELIAIGHIGKVRDAKESEVARAAKIIDLGDAPILAAALAAKSDFLVTLDRKDFFTLPILEASLQTEIILPGNFIQKYFS